MNTIAGRFTILLKVVILLVISGGLTGCAVMDLAIATPIGERMQPQSVICGKDGIIAVKVESSYWRYSFVKILVYNHYLMFFDHFGADHKYNPMEKVTLKYHQPRLRYLVLDPVCIQALIEKDKPPKEYIPSIEHSLFPPVKENTHYIECICFPDPDYVDFLSKCLFGPISKLDEEATIIPQRFWAASPTFANLPPSFNPAIAVEHKLDELIPYKLGANTVFLKFDHLKFDDEGRSVSSWWGYPFVVGIYYAPLTVTGLAYRLPQIPFIIIGRLLSPHKDTQVNKPQS